MGSWGRTTDRAHVGSWCAALTSAWRERGHLRGRGASSVVRLKLRTMPAAA